MKNELRNVISGKNKVRYGATIQSIASFLKRSKGASKVAKNSKLYKQKEAEDLKKYITENNLWAVGVDITNYISEGAEQKVYLEDGKHVLKLNDAIFYASWEDYLNNLLLHNYYFEDTAYELIGFIEEDETLYAVVKQYFVRATEKTNLEAVKEFLTANGFINTKNNDYRHPELGIILEDLHDENVLSENGVLRFIDTVFFVTENFYED
ncbi:MAG: hypothetical protein ABI388_01135 [Bacteroidia bacterium]